MMNLDDTARFYEIDAQSMHALLSRMPDDLEAAWQAGQDFALPANHRLSRILIAGVGTAAIAAEMLAALVADSCNIPISVQRGYDLPAYADGQSTLVIMLDHSGDSEEIYSILEQTEARGTQTISIISSGPLADYTQRSQRLLWQYAPPIGGSARTALVWQVGLLCALFSRLGLVRDLSTDIAEAAAVLRNQQSTIAFDSPTIKNPAKRQAGQMIGRIPYAYGGGIMAPIAQHWKNQLHENAKVIALADELPDLNYNTLSGLAGLPNGVRLAAVCLASPTYDHPRVRLRQNLTRGVLMMEGVVPDTYTGQGESALAHMMSAVQYGDYTSYYLAMALEVDPTPTPALDEVRGRLAR